MICWLGWLRPGNAQGKAMDAPAYLGVFETLEWPQKGSRITNAGFQNLDATLTQFVIPTIDVPTCGIETKIR